MIRVLQVVDHADGAADESVASDLLKQGVQVLQLIDDTVEDGELNGCGVGQEESQILSHGLELCDGAEEVFGEQHWFREGQSASIQFYRVLSHAFVNFVSLAFNVSASDFDIENTRLFHSLSQILQFDELVVGNPFLIPGSQVLQPILLLLNDQFGGPLKLDSPKVSWKTMPQFLEGWRRVRVFCCKVELLFPGVQPFEDAGVVVGVQFGSLA